MITMKWHRTGDTAMRCEPWTVSRITVRGVNFYELWHDKQPQDSAPWGRFSSFDAAKHAAEQTEIAGQG